MASKVNSTPTLSGRDAEKFIEKLNTTSTDDELRSLKKSDETFKKIKYNHFLTKASFFIFAIQKIK